jgi:hypothetical protein
MISVPLAHVGGIPIEETLGSFGPPLLVGFGVVWTQLRARLRRVCPPASADAPRTTSRRIEDQGRGAKP